MNIVEAVAILTKLNDILADIFVTSSSWMERVQEIL